jgi:hypothetical protein
MAETGSGRARRTAATGTEAELTARIAMLEERLTEIEEQAGSGEPFDRLFADLIPTEARSHLRAARKEQLLAARSFLDHWIDRLDRKPMPKERRRKESIPLE